MEMNLGGKQEATARDVNSFGGKPTPYFACTVHSPSLGRSVLLLVNFPPMLLVKRCLLSTKHQEYKG